MYQKASGGESTSTTDEAECTLHQEGLQEDQESQGPVFGQREREGESSKGL